MLWTYFPSFLLFLVTVVLGASNVSSEAQNYGAYTEAALIPLMKWYESSTGLWNTTGWWNSANILTMLGDFAAVDKTVFSQVEAVFGNTLVQAQKFNLGQTKVITSNFMMVTEWDANIVVNPKGFVNGFYDDEGWWALGWIQAFDITGNQTYLTTAIDIFTDMTNGATTPCGGGIWWDKAHTYVNAIANELYLSVAAHLANRVPASQKSFYVNIAQSQWTWFQASGMINAQGNINDGLNSSCKSNGGTIWSYNQGVILGALVELNRASPSNNNTYLSTARTIANAAIKSLGSTGVLHDPCEPNCGGDGNQFKGIFMRNLQILQTASPSPDKEYLEFIKGNADSIWANDRDKTNELGVSWSGPVGAGGNATASTQSSAMDALVAATAFDGQITGGGIGS